MQQTAVAVAETKDQITVDAEPDLVLATTLVSGLFCFSYAVVVTLVVLTVAVAVVMTAACGLLSYCSSVAALAETEAVVVADATTVATRIR